MFLDARSAEQARDLRGDVCIVGAGAAGITLAHTLAGAGLDVILLESGGFALETETQRLYETTNRGQPYPPGTASRLRYFGGTTNHWGGAVRPLDAFEFEPHEWVPDSGWPITRAELDPYYERAGPLLGLETGGYDADPGARRAPGDPPLLDPNSPDLQPVLWRRARFKWLRMGGNYRPAIDASPRIRCLHHANVSELLPERSGHRVASASVATLGGRRLRVGARFFVLAAGAIENARLLLMSDSRTPGGLGNRHDLVGRYFADHAFQLGTVLITRPSPTGWYRQERLLAPGGLLPAIIRDVAGHATTPAFRSRRKLLGFSVMAHSLSRAEGDEAAEAVKELAGSNSGERSHSISLFFVAEKAPNPSSRILLTRERDALGLRKVAVDLRVTKQDWQSFEESRRAFAVALGRSGAARLRVPRFAAGRPWCVGSGGHQSGTTRMADDPKRGVTDRNGRVHGIDNLFVAGSSLYPTAGWQHPTLTILALALRQADHLSELAKRG